jgi:hypothetical protein
MKIIISVEKEFLTESLWSCEDGETFYPIHLESKIEENMKFKPLSKMSEELISLLDSFGRKWEKTNNILVDEKKYDKKIVKQAHSNVVDLEKIAKKLALKVKEEMGNHFSYCYWSDSQSKRVSV